MAKPRGFASMSPERRQEIARRGAQRLHQKGKAHQFTSAEAKTAVARRESLKRNG